MKIGEYTPVAPFVTAGSGDARWCVAEKNGDQYFLKQFLSPVQPVQTTKEPAKQVLLRRQQCAAFETRKLRLYEALRKVPGDCIVHVEDFFVHDGHYYAASAYLGDSYQTLDTYKPAKPEAKLQLLVSLCECLTALHAQGVVHADLKPEHIVVDELDGEPHIRLLDFDSGFLETEPPSEETGIEIDPVYMSPEAYLLITGRKTALSRKLDTFTLGMLIHETLTDDLPGYCKMDFHYLYAAVLDGGKLALSHKLSSTQHALIRKMLRKNPARRPVDDIVCKKLRKMLL